MLSNDVPIPRVDEFRETERHAAANAKASPFWRPGEPGLEELHETALVSPRPEDERVWDSSLRITLNVRAKRSPRCSLDAWACHRPPHKQHTPCHGI